MNYKKLPLDKRFEISLSGSIKKDGKVLENVGLDDSIYLELDGKKSEWPVSFLRYVAHFEMRFNEKELNNVTFVGCDSKLLSYQCGMMVIHTKPIVYKKIYRVVPGLPRYAVSKDGEVISTQTGNILTIWHDPNSYPSINLYDPDKGKYRSVYLHILLARSWIPNKDSAKYLFVNHRDGDKNNYALKNLEWTTSVKNNRHALENGLRNDNVPCRVYDLETGVFTEMLSISEASSFIGYRRPVVESTVSLVNGTLRPTLLARRYFIIRNDSGFSDAKIVEFGKEGLITNTGPYQAKSYKTKKLFEHKTIRGLSKLTGVNQDRLGAALRIGGGYLAGEFMVRSKSSDVWPKPVVPNYTPPKKIQASKNTEVRIFKSLRQASLFFKCDKSTITNRLNGKITKPYEGWKFKELDSPLSRELLSESSLIDGEALRAQHTPSIEKSVEHSNRG